MILTFRFLKSPIKEGDLWGREEEISKERKRYRKVKVKLGESIQYSGFDENSFNDLKLIIHVVSRSNLIKQESRLK